MRTATSRAISMDLSSLYLNGLQLDKPVIQIRLGLWADTAQGCVERYTPFFDNTKTEVLQLGTAWVGENQIGSKMIHVRIANLHYHAR
jgi:glycine cleavage system regulatory protein